MPLPAIVAALGRIAPALMGSGGGAAGAAHGIEGAAALYKGGGAAGAGGGLAGLTDMLAGNSGQALQTVSAIQALVGSIGGMPKPAELAAAGVKKLHDTFVALPAEVLKAKEMIVSTGRAWVEALAAPAKVVRELGDSISQFTRLSNPAAVKMFEYRIENTFATIGRTLEPIMQALTRSAEKVGDAFARLRPAMEPVARGVAELIDTITDWGGVMADSLGPTLQMASLHFLAMARVIDTLQRPITELNRKFNELRRGVLELLGLPTGVDEGARSDVAVREPRYGTVESIQREAARNSLMASLNPDEQQKRDVPSLLQAVVTFLNQNLSKKVLHDTMVRALKEAKNAVTDHPLAGPGLKLLGSDDDGSRSGLSIEAVREFSLADLIRQRQAMLQES